jgi:hypothetical protein
MFLSHQCITLGMQYKQRLPAPLDRQFFTFADLVFKVREAGIDIFQAQLLAQRDQGWKRKTNFERQFLPHLFFVEHKVFFFK